MSNLIYIIPAYQPTQALCDVVQNLRALTTDPILVVNDGSRPECADIFKKIEVIPAVILLQHDINRGKGEALKTAFNYALTHFEALIGVVTLDADGQHRPEDAVLVAEKLLTEQNALVLGCREFDANHKVPLRSQFGNQLTKFVFKTLTGVAVSDSQTGLRGIPLELLKSLVTVSSTGYEFETEMLLMAVRKRIQICEVGIRTIYLDGNSSSHFNPLMDSIRIYSILGRFAVTSIMATIKK